MTPGFRKILSESHSEGVKRGKQFHNLWKLRGLPRSLRSLESTKRDLLLQCSKAGRKRLRPGQYVISTRVRSRRQRKGRVAR
jgi:hypothetical protein